MKPSNFTCYPWSCVLRKAEAESIARNIMVILKRTGDTWRHLAWDEYKEERDKDDGCGWNEQTWFEKVNPYCKSPDTAALFSPEWEKITNQAAKEAAQ